MVASGLIPIKSASSQVPLVTHANGTSGEQLRLEREKPFSCGISMVTISETAERVAEPSVESSASGVEWAAIWGGALAAVAISIILLTLGPGLKIASVTPWSFAHPTPTEFGTAAAIWLVVTQWLASAFGGYLSGRLRKKWVGIRTDEVLFRDTAHGFLAWALATVIVAGLVTLGSMAVAGVAAAAASATPAVPPSPEAAEQARKIAEAFAFTTSLSLLIGAFVAIAAGALGGFHRDEA